MNLTLFDPRLLTVDWKALREALGKEPVNMRSVGAKRGWKTKKLKLKNKKQ